MKEYKVIFCDLDGTLIETISRSSWQNNCLLIEFIDDEMHTKTREK